MILAPFPVKKSGGAPPESPYAKVAVTLALLSLFAWAVAATYNLRWLILLSWIALGAAIVLIMMALAQFPENLKKARSLSLKILKENNPFVKAALLFALTAFFTWGIGAAFRIKWLVTFSYVAVGVGMIAMALGIIQDAKNKKL